MKKIVLLGSNSFIGKNFISENNKYHIKAVSRSSERTKNKNIEFIKCESFTKNNLKQIFENGDIVINCVYGASNENERIIENIILAANHCKIAKLIHISSAVVAGHQENKYIDEEAKCLPITNYQKLKYKLEKLLLNSNLTCKLIILRPTAVFGEGGLNLVKNLEEIKNKSILKNILKFLILGNRQMHLVTIKNIVESIKFVIDTDFDKQKELFIVSQDDDPNNTYKNIYINSYKLIHNLDISFLKIFILPKSILLLIFKIFRKRYEEIFTTYSSKKIKLAGFIFKEQLLYGLKDFIKRN
tara:strand:+ start:23740 stop:24639 length:900 start_codon:yes stop_codon:yes gene_type:complete